MTSTQNSVAVSVANVSHEYRDAQESERRVSALEGISMDLVDGGCTAIVGPSGCGKTTLLNMIGGLVTPTRGTVTVWDKKPVVGDQLVGYLFARDSLLPWRTAIQNVELPLQLKSVPRSERSQRASDMLDSVGLEDFKDSYPSQLSQGMKQRVALARTLVTNPKLVLMDEPFSALDAQTRFLMHEEFLGLWEAHKSTVLLITHDLAEAITLADRVLVLSRRPGRIKARFEIDLARPRRVGDLQGSAEYHDLYTEIWNVLEEELLDVEIK